jgi:hypothetical protein
VPAVKFAAAGFALAGALLLIDPGLVTDVVGLVLLGVGLGLQALRRAPVAAPTPGAAAARTTGRVEP